MRLAILAAALLAASAQTSVAATPIAETSSNWAGYAVKDASFSSASGSWVQPRATCGGASPSYAAFWVGLGGYGDESAGLEQIGTAADCDELGAVSYYAWYELVPAPPVNLKLRIAAGDRVSASVSVKGTTVSLTLTNATRGTSVTKRATVTAPDVSSAEWVAEAPSTCGSFGGCRPLPLTNFGRIAFAKATATAAGHTGTISDPAWTPVSVTLAGGDPFSGFRRRTLAVNADANPGALTAGGASFAVTWKQSQAQPDPGYGDGGDPRAW